MTMFSISVAILSVLFGQKMTKIIENMPTIIGNVLYFLNSGYRSYYNRYMIHQCVQCYKDVLEWVVFDTGAPEVILRSPEVKNRQRRSEVADNKGITNVTVDDLEIGPTLSDVLRQS